MGGRGDVGVGGVRSLVLALTAQGEGVVAGVVRARISSLSGRPTVCLHLVRVCGVHMGVCAYVCVREKERGKWSDLFIYFFQNAFVCLCACARSEEIQTRQRRKRSQINTRPDAQADKHQTDRDGERMGGRIRQMEG